MYICICKAVSERSIQRAVDTGRVVSLRDLAAELGVGKGCGKCVPAAREALAASRLKRFSAVDQAPACAPADARIGPSLGVG